jgi:hypothetical protein
MPIAATLPLLKTQLESIFNSGIAGKPNLMALQITSAVASVLPSGLFPVGTAFIPPPPVGFSATQAQLGSSFNMGIAGKADAVALQIASAIAALSPIVPPTGLSLLQTQLKQAFSMDIAGKSTATAALIASAIITYYQTGLVV